MRRLELLAAASILALSACSSTWDEPLPTGHVALRFGAETQDATWTVRLDRAFLCLHELDLYGMDAAEAGYGATNPNLDGSLKHAGHPQGEADRSMAVAGPLALDLSGPPARIQEGTAPVGHYFDGKLLLGPCPLHGAVPLAGTGGHLPEDHPLRGHTLVLEGTASRDASTTYRFTVTVDAEVAVKGIEYGATVREATPIEITTLLNVSALLARLDLPDLPDQDGGVVVGPGDTTGAYERLEAALADPASYRHEELEPLPAH